jgi:hypothetical protein
MTVITVFYDYEEYFVALMMVFRIIKGSYDGNNNASLF